MPGPRAGPVDRGCASGREPDLYGGTRCWQDTAAEVLREQLPAVLVALACPGRLVVALRWYGRQSR